MIPRDVSVNVQCKLLDYLIRVFIYYVIYLFICSIPDHRRRGHEHEIDKTKRQKQHKESKLKFFQNTPRCTIFHPIPAVEKQGERNNNNNVLPPGCSLVSLLTAVLTVYLANRVGRNRRVYHVARVRVLGVAVQRYVR